MSGFHSRARSFSYHVYCFRSYPRHSSYSLPSPPRIIVDVQQPTVQVCDQALNAPPAEIRIGEFLGGMDYFHVIPYDNDSPEARADTVEIARMSIGHEEWTVPGYSPLTNNCEHFATFCKTGQKSSTQADTARTVLSGLLALAGYSSVLVLAPNDDNDP